MTLNRRALLSGILLAAFQGTGATAQTTVEIPDRPEQLIFPTLTFDVPDPAPLRTELGNGVAVYIAEDRSLPLVTIAILFPGGRYLEPDGREGLAQLTSTVWRTGGAGEMSGAELDEELDFLAAGLGTSIGGATSSISLNVLSKDLERGLELLMDALQHPGFEEARLEKARADLLAAMQRRNDSSAGLEAREWSRLIYGDDFWVNREPTESSVNAITRQDLVDFQRRLVRSDDMVLAVSGDFESAEMLERLEATVGAIAPRGDTMPEVPQPMHRPRPGVYLVDKPDVNQGRVSIGHIGLKRPVPDEFALLVANDILGGGGFTSRILSRVRSDEGLAYSAGSFYGIDDEMPGIFRAAFQSRSATVGRAAHLVVDLIKELLAEGVTEPELVTSRNSFVETFPNGFASRFSVVLRYASDELVGRDHRYWTEYRERIRAVTAGSAQEAARRHIRPDQLVILVVGKADEILRGHPDHPDASLQVLGPVTRLPLRDPMTLEPLPAGAPGQ